MDTVKYVDDADWAAACTKARARLPQAKPLPPPPGARVVIVYPKLYDLLGLTEAQKLACAAQAERS